MNLADYLLALYSDIQEAILDNSAGEKQSLVNNLAHICETSQHALDLPVFDECKKPELSTS